MGLVDTIERGDIVEAAVRFANALVEAGTGPRRVRDFDAGLGDPSSFAKAVATRRTEPGGDAAEARAELIACVEGALLLPFEEGLAFEEAAFETVSEADTAQALRHLYFAERGARRFPDLAQIAPREINRVALVGGGDGVPELALRCLRVGLSVILAEPDEAALEESYATLGEAFDRAVAMGHMTEAEADDGLSRLRLVCGFTPLTGSDLVIDTTRGTGLAAQNAVALDMVMQAGAIFATMATQDAGRIAAAVAPARRANILGLALHGDGALEILETATTSRTVAASAIAFAANLGAIAVRSRAEAGGAGARLQFALHAAADALVLRGASPDDVDRALMDWGLAEGPFAMRERIGLDAAPRTPLTKAVLLAGGTSLVRFTETGMTTHPVATAEIARMRAATPDRPRTVSHETITRGTLAALANAGARLLGEAAVRSPADIDVLAVYALGLARRVGGPMKAADLVGLLPVRKSLDRLETLAPGAFQPAPLIDDLIKNGRRFSNWTAA